MLTVATVTTGGPMSEATEPQGTAFHQSLGLRWRFPDRAVVVSLELRDDMRGPAGALEGGIVSTLIDVAGASVAAGETGRLVVTTQMSISFLAPGRVGPITAIGRTLRVGRDDVVSEVRVTDEGNDDRLVASGLVTLKLAGDLPKGYGRRSEPAA